MTASRESLGPLSKTVPAPVGAMRASWSKVNHSPPAFRILSLAVLVKRRAHTRIFGTSYIRTSSVMVPTSTAIFPLFPSMNLANYATQKTNEGKQKSEKRKEAKKKQNRTHAVQGELKEESPPPLPSPSCLPPVLGLKALNLRTYLRQRQRWFVGLAHKQSLQNDLVELRVCSSCKKLVELHEQLQVDIV